MAGAEDDARLIIGRLSLTSADGIRFGFLAPENAVREPVAVRMTVITNFSAFPEHDGFRAAVAFEPEGFANWT